MTEASRKTLALVPIADDPEVGRWLAALEDCRRDTLREHRSHIAWLRDTFLTS